ncbi:gamma-glutamylcyclotransferase (GGCT)/AIG2-like uncharacterized protein YtfP [Litorivivens lipolytica]|uniref:Putative gamma-glutamylcyclotransferase n=1 Tax=Litorivivens lipolytica TaxID=1524264 RepID=A0A7W4W4F8_9GAMM|nr:gamma-glutamylcyclotransferase family protein [Litorivivens lipolytica]MBB3047288.1 gamma-glutamylcyclotransferase (GGCT)/AIG2-like uncharacterized protein YtfP [Litorivivens lipolytica]
MSNLFCYGTLMYKPLLRALLERDLSAEPATLEGYACFAIRSAAYPGIVAAEGNRVSGLLVRDIPPGAWLGLDRYEGEFYRRETVAVVLADDSEVEASTYVMRPRFRSRLSQRAWQYGPEAERYAAAQCEALLQRKGR